jgi:HAD superfamily hydrolase (TIGR01662 family)
MKKEIVIIMGYNASGKSTLVEDFVKKGYKRLNRDISGGTVDDLAKNADVVLTHGSVVLDNTYPDVKSRASIIAVGKKHKIPVRCLWLKTSFEDAQLNACLRMVRKTGKLLQPEDFRTINDPNLFPPVALFHYRKIFQTPTLKEGFDQIEDVPFIRKWGPDYINKAIILDYDGTLRTNTGKQKYPCSPSEISILPGRTGLLKAFNKDAGYMLLGASNQSGIARGDVTAQAVEDCFAHTNKLLDLNIEVQYCSHRIPPVSCFCRKPHPGMGAYFIEKYKLNPSKCIMVGDMTTDETFAERCGFNYMDAEQFFALKEVPLKWR